MTDHADRATRALFLSVDQLLILLFKRGIDGIMFPEEIVKVSAGGRELKMAMEELVSDAVIVPDGDRFRFSDETGNWMEILENTDITCVETDISGSGQARYVYTYKDRMLLLQMDGARKDWVRLEIIDPGNAPKPESAVSIKKYHRGEDEPFEEYVRTENRK